MRLKKSKRGLTSGIFVIVVFLFFFGLFSLFSSKMWAEFNTPIQALGNETVSDAAKERIDALGVWFTWADTLFIIFFVALLISYAISAVTLEPQDPVFFIIFTLFVILITVFCMIFSNTWEGLITGTVFRGVADDYTFTTFFMKYFPFFTFFVAIGASLLFWGRKNIFEGRGAKGI